MSIVYLVGFLLGLSSALFFALYMVPQKITKLDHTTYLWTMGLGVLLTALVPYALAGCPHAASWLDRGKGILCGAVWGLGTLAFASSIHRIGMAVATPIKNTTGILGTLVGLVLLHEWRTTNPALCVTGSLLIVAAAIIIGQAQTRREAHRHTSASGVGFALIAACCYASYLYPLKQVVGRIGYREFTPWMAAGILLTASVAVLVRPGGVRALCSYPRRSYGLALLGGVAWAIALYSMAASMARIDLSVAWALAQLNTIPAVCIGSLIFHEIRFADHRTTLLLGLLTATVGTFVLGFAK